MSTSPRPALLDLPNPLVLLLHLHILSFPKCDLPEYSSTTLFAQNRPLRERTRTMEDVVSFLIEKVGGKELCKAVLGGTYPCSQPSDSVALRVNVSKYLESLRGSVVRPGSHMSTSKDQPATSKGRLNHSLSPNEPIPWWWPAVVVRKSLLEECFGIKFERMLLALSTHALFVQIPTCGNVCPKPSDLPTILQNQLDTYSRVLSQAQSLYKERVHSAFLLTLRVQELNAFKQRLASVPPCGENLPVDRMALLATQNSKFEDVLNAWKTAINGKHPCPSDSQLSPECLLEWLLFVAGCSTKLKNNDESTGVQNSAPDLPDISITSSNPTLNVAAANHFEIMKKLTSIPRLAAIDSAPLREPETGSSKSDDSSVPLHSSAMQDLMKRASTQNTSLVEALSSIMETGKRVQSSLRAKLAGRSMDGAAAAHNTSNERPCTMLWTANDIDIDFQAVQIRAFVDPHQQKYSSVLDLMPEDKMHIGEKFESSVLALRNSLSPAVPPIRMADEHSPALPGSILDISFDFLTAGAINERPFGLEQTHTQTQHSTPIKSHAPFINARIVTPRGPRRSTLLPSMIMAFTKASLAETFIGDMSLPPVVDDSVAGENEHWSEDGVSFEEHTLRDILLKAGQEI